MSGSDLRMLFRTVKARYEEQRPIGHGLFCKQGFYTECFVLKLQKPAWTNDRMDRVKNETGVFFSIWVDPRKDARRANYNIHALKLRELKGYLITSRNFAEAFRGRFQSGLADGWPNTSLDFGPQTLMQGWVDIEGAGTEDLLGLMKRFELVSPVIDDLLEARRSITKSHRTQFSPR